MAPKASAKWFAQLRRKAVPVSMCLFKTFSARSNRRTRSALLVFPLGQILSISRQTLHKRLEFLLEDSKEQIDSYEQIRGPGKFNTLALAPPFPP